MAGTEPKLLDLFSKAAECQSPEETAAYLEQVCQGDATLRARLEELLLAHRQAGSFLQEDRDCAELVKLRFFAGLTLDEAARALGVVRRTADRYWAFARSWLYAALSKSEEAGEP